MHPLKALLPMLDTDLPMVMDTSELHPSNELSPILATASPIVTFFILFFILLSRKSRAWNAVTGYLTSSCIIEFGITTD